MAVTTQELDYVKRCAGLIKDLSVRLDELRNQVQSLNKRFDRFTDTYHGVVDLTERLEAAFRVAPDIHVHVQPLKEGDDG